MVVTELAAWACPAFGEGPATPLRNETLGKPQRLSRFRRFLPCKAIHVVPYSDSFSIFSASLAFSLQPESRELVAFIRNCSASSLAPIAW